MKKRLVEIVETLPPGDAGRVAFENLFDQSEIRFEIEINFVDQAVNQRRVCANVPNLAIGIHRGVNLQVSEHHAQKQRIKCDLRFMKSGRFSRRLDVDDTKPHALGALFAKDDIGIRAVDLEVVVQAQCGAE